MVRESRVGVWWFWKGKVFDYSAPLSGAEKIGGFANGPLCHVDAWPDLQKAIPELADYDYSDIPRGRVIARDYAQFILYASKELIKNKAAVSAICARFNLDESVTDLCSDEHYEKTILRAELPSSTSDNDELAGLYKEFPELKDL